MHLTQRTLRHVFMLNCAKSVGSLCFGKRKNSVSLGWVRKVGKVGKAIRVHRWRERRWLSPAHWSNSAVIVPKI